MGKKGNEIWEFYRKLSNITEKKRTDDKEFYAIFHLG